MNKNLNKTYYFVIEMFYAFIKPRKSYLDYIQNSLQNTDISNRINLNNI